jgi:uncharacterized protein
VHLREKYILEWLDVLDNGHVLFVDELNNSMHPLMVRFLIGLINNPETNRKMRS